jgi:hypothetical protein
VIARVTALLLGVFGAVAASQLPEYSQQYRQRIGGAIDELGRIVARFDADAKAAGLSRAAALDRLNANAEDVARRQAGAAAENIRRLDYLARHQARLAETGSFRRVASVLMSGDTEIMRRTLAHYEPAVPTTAEGLTFAAFGFFVGWLTFAGGRAGVQRWRKRRPIRPEPARF